mmetsp:Transcript_41813/g.115295  ORF Transcript_41813/g.115295 Transcript_41813/m.115295 type:complete len:226 (+) Transcript_41813:85-762(+)
MGACVGRRCPHCCRRTRARQARSSRAVRVRGGGRGGRREFGGGRRRRRRRRAGPVARLPPGRAQVALQVRHVPRARPRGWPPRDRLQRPRPLLLGLCGDDAGAAALSTRRGAAGRVPAALRRLQPDRAPGDRRGVVAAAVPFRPRRAQARHNDERRHVHPRHAPHARPRRWLHRGALAPDRPEHGGDRERGRHGALVGRRGLPRSRRRLDVSQCQLGPAAGGGAT